MARVQRQRKMLEAISFRAKENIEYYDFVTIRTETIAGFMYGAVTNGPSVRKVYLCVGKHSIIFLKPNLHRLGKGGVIEYDWIDQVIEDTRSSTEFALSLNLSRSLDCPSQIFGTSQNRGTLFTQMSVAYLADAMLRIGRVESFPRFEAELKSEPGGAEVLPFQQYKQAFLGDYNFYIKNEFEEVVSTSGVKTGIYKAPVKVIPSASYSKGLEKDAMLEVSLHIYDPVVISDLRTMAREHIRWVAMEYKQALLRTLQTYVLRNKLYLKKMNLSNDVASWACWELFLQEPQCLTVAVLMRRQYAPPLCDTAQDFALVVKCPVSADKANKEFREDLVYEAHLMADTLASNAQNQPLSSDVVQAKLDALLYDEEAYGWIRTRLKLRPNGTSCLEKYATIFVKGILKVLRDENALEHPEIWDDASKRVAALCEKESEQDLDPLTVANQILLVPAEGGLQPDEDDEYSRRCLNAWHARVAQFLAYSVDGGLFGSRFVLGDIVNNLIYDKVSQTSARKLSQVLAFLLHLRPTDLSKAWEPKLVQSQLLAMGLVGPEASEECTFTDRVMQALIDSGYLQKLLPAGGGQGDMSPKYACLLTHLLQSGQASVNLKAAICRQIVAAKDNQGGILWKGLVHVLMGGGLFLATYATAALVNLSTRELVKNYLMRDGVELIILGQLESKDDDLTLYTLMLLVHLTKSSGHRKILVEKGVVTRLYKILAASYMVLGYKRRVLTELASVLGQLCNDEPTRKTICESYQYVVEYLLQILEAAEVLPGDRKPGESFPNTGTKVISKVLFALKQLCANSAENKEVVGARVIKFVVKDLQNAQNLEQRDWATNAILLLLLLAISRQNCQLILGADWSQTYQVLSSSPLGKLDATRDRIQQIDDRLERLLEGGQ